MKLKYILSITIGILLSIGFTGCGGAKVSVTKLEPLKSKVAKYPAIDALTGETLTIEESAVINIENIEAISQFPKRRQVGRFTHSKGYKGISIQTNNGILKLSYLTQILGSKVNRISSIVYDIKYTVNGNEITYTFPRSYTKKLSSSAIGIELKLPYSVSSIEKDAKKIFQNLDKMPYRNSYKLEGEVNSKYSEKSIYSNFKRMAVEVRRRGERGNTNTFRMKVGDKNIIVNIKITPYREGVKVQYTSYIRYYTFPNGTSSFSKADVDKAIKAIEKIVTD